MIRGSFIKSLTIVIVLVFRTVASSWTPWTSWSECSRSCGGGASFSRRHCVSNTAECDGESTKYRTCQNEDCGAAADDYRAMQCAMFNNTEFHGKYYSWIPEISKKNPPCALYCRAKHTEIVQMLSAEVLDGTRCYKDSYDMCIKGVCQPVGCDRELMSRKRLDVCGVCDGDGSTCRLVTGLYRSNPGKNKGTEVVITVPQNSRHISVSERGSGHVGLMLNDSANYDVIMPITDDLNKRGVIERSGVVVKYGSLSYGKEYFDVPGPVPKDMQVVAVYDESVWKYIRYEFYRPLEVMWIHNRTSASCTVTCGSGLQFVWPICVDVFSGLERSKKDCHKEGLTPPAPIVHRCNIAPCLPSYTEERIEHSFEYGARPSYSWRTDPWTECSASCAGGFQSRTFSCIETIDGRIFATADDSPCHRAKLPLPGRRRNCNEHACPRWKAHDWSECSATCGPGWQYRAVRCLSDDGQPGFNCKSGDKPEIRKPCLVRRTCIGEAVPIRIAKQPKRKTPENAAFMMNEVNSLSVKPSWVAESWGDCSATCGEGQSVRIVKCQVLLAFAGIVENLSDDQCSDDKPISIQQCSMGECVSDISGSEDEDDEVAYDDIHDYGELNDITYLDDDVNDTSVLPTAAKFDFENLKSYEWRYGEYGSCSPSCGNGSQTSDQRCIHIETGSLVSPDRCDLTSKGSSRTRPCGNPSCIVQSPGGRQTGWELGPFSDCDVKCGRGIRTRPVVCREMPEGENRTFLPYQQHLGKELPDMMCPSPKPEERQACSLVACHPKWVHIPTGKCSRTCGRGTQPTTLLCRQKLGTGETVTVPEDYCPRKRPVRSRQPCNLVDCKPRYFVHRRSRCRSPCGRSTRTRSVVCIQTKAGKAKPVRVPLSMCSHLTKPVTKNICSSKPCGRGKTHPVIHTSDEVFIQKKPQAKVRLQIGQRADILATTTVILKCHTNKKQIVRWRHNKTPIRRTHGHVSVLPDGSLRILRSRKSDSGKYTCIAWPSTASSFIRVKANVSGIADVSSIPSRVFKVPRHKAPSRRPSPPSDTRDNIDAGDSLEELSPVFPRPKERVPRFKPRPVQLVSPYEPPPKLVHPEISYVAAQPVVQLDLRPIPKEDRISSEDRLGFSNLHPLSNQPASSQSKDSNSVIRIALDYLSRNGVNRASGPINDLMQQVIENSDQYERGSISLEQYNAINEDIREQLSPLLNRDQVSARAGIRSTGSATLQRIFRLLENKIPEKAPSTTPSSSFAPAKIISQEPTTPLNLNRLVDAYVGGSLIVAGADRVTILCEATGNPPPQIKWFRDGNPLPEHGRQFHLQDGSLRLLYPQFSDAGTYTCVASNRYGNDSQSTALSVTQVPRILSTTTTVQDFTSDYIEVTIGSDIRAKLGARIKIRCPTEGFPDPYVVWTKDGPGLGRNTKVLTDNSLEIFPATAAYQGLFGCEASNPSGSDYQASSLVLIDPPHISDELSVLPDIDGVIGLPKLLMTGKYVKSYDVKANSSVMMGCPVAGFPEPRITWYFNHQPITDMGSTLDYQLLKQNKVLQIPNAGLDTEGVYSCLAQNDGGNLTTQLKLGLVVHTYEFGEMTSCSASCGGSGMQYRRLRCMQDGAVEVLDWFCTGLKRPAITMEPCNRIDCPPRFVLSPWGSCSVSCGNGTRSRVPKCVVIMFDGSTREVADANCLENETKTVETEPCFQEKCPQWRVGPWHSCSRKCVGRGVGGKTRRIYCVKSNGNKTHPRECSNQPRPRRRALCPNPRCEPVWVTSPWSVCSNTCGPSGIKTRILNCVYRGRKRQSAGSQCSIRRAPKVKLPCNRRKCLPQGRQSRVSKPSGGCVGDRFGWCPRVVKMGRCKTMKKYCCHSCR